MSEQQLQFIFRRLDDNIPNGWAARAHWIVEAYPAGMCNLPYPMGQAWVSDFTPYGKDLISLDFILVPDHCRRDGVAKALYNEVKKRWPTVFITDAISPAGNHFLNNVEPWRMKAHAMQIKDVIKERKKKRKKVHQRHQRR